MRLQQLADEGARNDDALVDIERQAAHVDLVDEIGGRFARRDALMDEVEDGLAFRGRDARVGKGLELVGMQMQGLADQEGGFRDRIGRAMGKGELRLGEAAHRIADEIDQREQLAAADFRELWRGAAARSLLGMLLPSGSGPACGGLVVTGVGLDPAGAGGALFLLPERRAGLEIVHQELGRLRTPPRGAATP